MEAVTYFTDFLSNIRPTDDQRAELARGHITLRERLDAFEPLKPAIITTFLQGSYRRATALRPLPGKRSDVDIIVVTRLHEREYTPAQALDLFRPFVEKYYKGQYRFQGRSIGIQQRHVDLDLVPTSAPPESVMGVLPEAGDSDAPLDEETTEQRLRKAARYDTWRQVPLRIPDRAAMLWEDTHPIAQMQWTREKNAATNGHFVNVVKAVKWWRYTRSTEVEQPKSYPLERIIADCCPDGVCSVAEGVVRTLEGIVSRYRNGKPVLPDHGCHPDVLKRVTEDEIRRFYRLVEPAAALARWAYDAEDIEDSARYWRELFGDKFPAPPPKRGEGPTGGFTPRSGGPSKVESGRFA